jgi:hypothetical protein
MEQGMKRLLLAGRGQWRQGLWEEGNLTMQEHPNWLSIALNQFGCFYIK